MKNQRVEPSNNGWDIPPAAVIGFNLLSFAAIPKVVFAQSNPSVCAGCCILFSVPCLMFVSVYAVQKRQRLRMLGAGNTRTAEMQDSTLHVLSWLTTLNCVVAIVLLLVAVGARFHNGPLHPIPF